VLTLAFTYLAMSTKSAAHTNDDDELRALEEWTKAIQEKDRAISQANQQHSSTAAAAQLPAVRGSIKHVPAASEAGQSAPSPSARAANTANQARAENEKIKGNEFFRAKQYEQALQVTPDARCWQVSSL